MTVIRIVSVGIGTRGMGGTPWALVLADDGMKGRRPRYKESRPRGLRRLGQWRSYEQEQCIGMEQITRALKALRMVRAFV